MVIGYIRVSTSDQNEARQVEALKKENCEKFYIDKCSGKNLQRPEFKKMMDFIREGDTLIISEYSRLARSTSDLLSTVNTLNSKGVQLISLKEKLDTTTAQGKLMLTMFAALSEFERELILERQREGIAIAKEQGKYKGRQPIPYDEKNFLVECERWLRKEQTATETMRKLNMKPNRFYRLVKKHKLIQEHNDN